MAKQFLTVTIVYLHLLVINKYLKLKYRVCTGHACICTKISYTLKYHGYILMFTKISLVKLIHIYVQIYLYNFFLSISLPLSSPQVWLHPDNLPLLLPDDGAEAGQQRVVVTPGVWSHAVIQTRQLVQQRLLAL